MLGDLTTKSVWVIIHRFKVFTDPYKQPELTKQAQTSGSECSRVTKTHSHFGLITYGGSTPERVLGVRKRPFIRAEEASDAARAHAEALTHWGSLFYLHFGLRRKPVFFPSLGLPGRANKRNVSGQVPSCVSQRKKTGQSMLPTQTQEDTNKHWEMLPGANVISVSMWSLVWSQHAQMCALLPCPLKGL